MFGSLRVVSNPPPVVSNVVAPLISNILVVFCFVLAFCFVVGELGSLVVSPPFEKPLMHKKLYKNGVTVIFDCANEEAISLDAEKYWATVFSVF